MAVQLRTSQQMLLGTSIATERLTSSTALSDETTDAFDSVSRVAKRRTTVSGIQSARYGSVSGVMFRLELIGLRRFNGSHGYEPSDPAPDSSRSGSVHSRRCMVGVSELPSERA